MTDTRMERIINQLAELTEEEEQVLIDRITVARERRQNEKFYKLRDSFFDTWREIENLGYSIYWQDCLLDAEDITLE